MYWPYGYPPPGYISPAPTPQPTGPAEIVSMIASYKKMTKDLEDLLKKPKEESKPRTYSQQQLLAYMAIGALPIGFIWWFLLISAVQSLGKGFGLIP